MTATMKEQALKYAEMRLAVFPLKPRDKRPATEKGCKAATTDLKQIETWWNTCPDFNIGIATGGISGGLVVIDLDIDKEKSLNGYEVLQEWQRQNGELPETWTSITGRGGYHLLYKDTAMNRNKVGLYDGVDIRGEGGYIVAPPSIHPNGRSYEWELGLGDGEIAQADERVIKFLLGPAEEKEEKQSFSEPEIIPEGQRVSMLVKLAGSLKAKGLDDEAIRAAVRVENEKKCMPPLTEQELEKEVLTALKRGWEAERPYTAVTDGGKFRKQKQKQEKTSLICVKDVEEKEVNWLYSPYVPKGRVTLCAAYPGTGKTYLLCYMTACVTTGKSFFGIVPFDNKPGKVIFLTSEDGIGDTIKARLRICGANMENVYTVADNRNQLYFDSPEIEEYLQEVKPELMIFDPFQSYIGSDVDMNAPNKTRERLNRILELAEKYDVAVVLICHFNKNQKGDAITRVLGSTDIMGLCRSYIALGNVPGEEDVKFMSHEKSSLEKRGKTILFKIDPDNGGIVCLGENALSMDDYTALRAKKRVNDAPAIEAAKQFIISNMPGGRRKAKELLDLAKANKISESSMRRARDELEIIQKKTNTFPSITEWILPGHEQDEPVVAQEELTIMLDQSIDKLPNVRVV